jgi:hypothetical protein
MSSKLTITIPVWLDLIFVWPVLLYRQWKYGYWFRKIFIGDGRYTIVDPPIFYQLNHFHWYAEGQDIHIYAVRNIIKPGCKSRSMRLSREIMNAPAGLLVDHRNNNTLDNRRANLRLATHSQNTQNRGKWRIKASSQFVGVSFDKENELWRAYIRYQEKRIHLGRFDSEIDAARAYDEAAKKYFGEFAHLNLPEETNKKVLSFKC